MKSKYGKFNLLVIASCTMGAIFAITYGNFSVSSGILALLIVSVIFSVIYLSASWIYSVKAINTDKFKPLLALAASALTAIIFITIAFYQLLTKDNISTSVCIGAISTSILSISVYFDKFVDHQ